MNLPLFHPARENPAQETNTQVVQNLRQQIRKIETLPRSQHGPPVSTGSTELDQLLPEQGLARGTVNSWHQPAGGCGGEILSLIAARNACHHSQHNHSQHNHSQHNHSPRGRRQHERQRQHEQQRALVIIDPGQNFYPPAAVMWGINLKQTVIIRCPAQSFSQTPESQTAPSKILWAIQQALQCPAVGAIWGCLPTFNERWSRRFQLAAEQHGTMAMFVHRTNRNVQPSWAEVQWMIEPHVISRSTEPTGILHGQVSAIDGTSCRGATPVQEPVRPNVVRRRRQQSHGISHSRQIQLKLQRVRGGRAGATAKVEIDFSTGILKTVSQQSCQTSRENRVSANHHEKNSLYLASQLADPKTRRRSQRA